MHGLAHARAHLPFGALLPRPRHRARGGGRAAHPRYVGVLGQPALHERLGLVILELAHEQRPGRNAHGKEQQPVVLDGDRVLVSASFNAGCVLLQAKAEADGKFSVAEVWKNRNMKSEFSNLVARGGCVYGLDDGILACIDIATGERKWKDGRYGHGQVMLVDDWLLVQTEQGPVALVEANPAGYREVARLNALGAKTWNTPALAGELLLVRNDQEAACYRLAKRGSQTAGL